ncbi:MAG: ATP-binding protein, partial [Deltaproteobacteria bacterium]|nr:ATP-binding protein [Deltaproteobacteria bacterium]
MIFFGGDSLPMNIGTKKDDDLHSLVWAAVLAVVGWTCLCLVSGYFYVSTEKSRTLELARKEALTVFDKDQAFRHWATSHGRVYVPLTKDTQPNPALSHLPERDIITQRGVRFTMLDPATMMRQIMDKYEELYGVKCQITTLDLLAVDKDNGPVEWAQRALEKFEQGVPEHVEVIDEGGHSWLRLIRPLAMEESCLKCHAAQGEALGEALCAVEVAVSLTPYRAMESRSLWVIYLTHGLFWLFGLLVVAGAFVHGKRRMEERRAHNLEIADSFQKIKFFAYSVSHDLKNPVVSIHGLSIWLEKKYGNLLGDKGNQYCRQIMSSAEQISKLVDQINTYISTKEQPLDVELIDLKDIFAQVRQEHSRTLARRSIQWREPDHVPAVSADRLALLRVFRNFIDNALKYGGEGLGNIEIAYEDDPHYHIFSVHNDGASLTPEACRKVFELFSREVSNQSISGSGLGLAIVKEIAELHAGKVWSESIGDN